MLPAEVLLAESPVHPDLILPVILSGGSGTRLWPLSRPGLAKPLLPLAGESTLLQDTLRRVAGREGFAPALVVGAADDRAVLAAQVGAVDAGARLLLETARRGTFAAVLLAACHVEATSGNRLLAVLPSDQTVGDYNAFAQAIRDAAGAADRGLVLIGTRPGTPSRAYGYVCPDAAATADGNVLSVARFVEKPDEALAAKLIAAGALWNAGIFVFRAAPFLAAMQDLHPEVLAAMRAACAACRDAGAAVTTIGTDDLAPAPGESFDREVTERLAGVRVVAAAYDWSDAGSWDALWRAADKDADGNAARGDVIALDTRRSLVRAESRTVCTIGLDGMAVVETPDAVLVAPLDRAQDVRGLVERMEADRRPAADRPGRVERPWGWYQVTDQGDRFKVKHLMVSPGACLSRQRHHHRAEHWVIVRGTAEVAVDGLSRTVHENESVFIPIGAVHRLTNPGRIPLEIVEVQTGPYLEEDDIERFEDPAAE